LDCQLVRSYDLAVSWSSRLFAFLTLTFVATATLTAQPPRKLPEALTQMIDAERAFAARALVVGWKQAFLEYFADDAVGFEGGPGLAKEQIRKNPDPPSDLQLVWEPRYGDVAASGDLGYLTGPVRNIRKSRDNGRPRHSTYASIWKRQRDGSFKVVMDFGLGTPGPASFAPGFTRAPVGNRFSGDYDETTPPLSAADGVLNSGLRTQQADGYRGRLASGVRFLRPNAAPVVGDRAALRWLATQRPYSAIDARFAESARSGDLGYTWGSYATGPAQKPTQQGFYVRAWQRERNGQWNVVMDVLQPSE
jgi:ketosteroid isomerase-like protein